MLILKHHGLKVNQGIFILLRHILGINIWHLTTLLTLVLLDYLVVLQLELGLALLLQKLLVLKNLQIVHTHVWVGHGLVFNVLVLSNFYKIGRYFKVLFSFAFESI